MWCSTWAKIEIQIQILDDVCIRKLKTYSNIYWSSTYSQVTAQSFVNLKMVAQWPTQLVWTIQYHLPLWRSVVPVMLAKLDKLLQNSSRTRKRNWFKPIRIVKMLPIVMLKIVYHARTSALERVWRVSINTYFNRWKYSAYL